MPRAGLTRDIVIEAGLRAADAGDLSLAAVAADLGVRVPSLYKHVAGLEDLTRGVAVRCVLELTAVMSGAAIGVAGPDAVRALGRAYREWARRKPHRYALAQRAPDPADAQAIAAAEAAVAVVSGALAAFELKDDALVDAVRGLRAAIHGFVSLEAAGGFGMPRSTDASFDALVDSLVRSY